MKRVQPIVLVFASVHDTLKAETCLKSSNWSFVMIPLSPAINEGCGLGIQIDSTDQQAVVAYLEEYEIIPIKAVTI